jgi:hypothetical protein
MMRYLDITLVQRTFYHAGLKIENGSSELSDFDAHLLIATDRKKACFTNTDKEHRARLTTRDKVIKALQSKKAVK